MITTLVWTVLFLSAVGFFLYQIYGRLQVLLKSRKDDGRDYSLKTLTPRLKNLLKYGFGQAKFFKNNKEQPAGIIHVLVFWAFLVLGGQVTMMFFRGWFPEFHLPGFGFLYVAGVYGFLKDIFQTIVICGVLVLLYRWAISKPTRLYGFLPAEARLRGQSHGEAYLILCFIMTIMISGFLYDAGRLIAFGDIDFRLVEEARFQPITSFIASLLPQDKELAATLAKIGWWLHNTVILVFLNLLPRSKHFHIVTALFNVFFGKVEAKGHLPKKDYTADNAIFGRSQVDQFTWKQKLDMYSCTECGRCSSMCPATATGKPLAPRQMLLNLRDAVYQSQSALIQPIADGATAPQFEALIGENKAVIDEVVWSCVQCRACEEACPVNIEYVDKIVDMRQHLVQEASRFPSELNRTFKGLETQSNPWGISREERDNWAENMQIPRIQENPNPEYLYYVGCGGSFDSNNRKTTQSFAKILKEAKVNFAILGKEELCNGETARRLGNEYLYQTMAEMLVGLLNQHNVKKILVNCPHCFNTLAKEYPDFGGNYQVIRAADFVKTLIAEGKLVVEKTLDKKVVYHDSCNYGRFNGIYDEQRDVIQSIPGVKFEELSLSKDKGTCCGAGGGRMWLEEPKDQRVNIMRADQALEKKPDIIATSCPFCKIMLGSAINEKGVNEQVQVLDVMEMVASNIKEQQ